MTEGLFLTGTVSGRTKRMVGKDKSTELVTYKIMAGKRLFYLKDWQPDEYYSVGEILNVPVSVKTFTSNGHVMLDFSIAKNTNTGEEF